MPELQIYKQITDFCRGDLEIDTNEINSLKAEAAKILAQIRRDEAAGKLPIISISRETSDLEEIENFAAHIRKKFSKLVILGTGGSSLCGHAVAGFAQGKFATAGAKVIFMENIDPSTFEDFFRSADLKNTAFLAISKSGVSVETLMQFLVCLEQAKNIDIEKHFFAITEPGDNSLRQISAQYGIKVYDHNPNIGGRFSILSLVGLMPGIVAGINAQKFRNGAYGFFRANAQLAVESAAIHVAMMRKNIWQNVLMTYPDRLEDFNTWYRQIWAESLGKNGTGSTPIKALGTIDQHSQMQLYLAGRKDKFYNFITLKMPETSLKSGKIPGRKLSYLSNKTMSEVINAEQKATIETLCTTNRPLRIIELQKLDDENFGALVMHAMLETIITAHLLGVNPYDQPAVEAGKILTREILSKN